MLTENSIIAAAEDPGVSALKAEQNIKKQNHRKDVVSGFHSAGDTSVALYGGQAGGRWCSESELPGLKRSLPAHRLPLRSGSGTWELVVCHAVGKGSALPCLAKNLLQGTAFCYTERKKLDVVYLSKAPNGSSEWNTLAQLLKKEMQAGLQRTVVLRVGKEGRWGRKLDLLASFPSKGQFSRPWCP
uniref:Uncharacterized protein n=1 Tax=Sphaerodactylus townsendi TaxID=933632 RepID=A0ACB8FEQ5_9SAUR